MPKTKKFAVVGLLATLGVAIVGYFVLSPRVEAPPQAVAPQEESKSPEMDEAEPTSTPQSASPARYSSPVLPESLPPMPAGSLPLAQQLSALTQRAEAGDPTAACRLAIAANYCIELQRHRDFSQRVNRSLESRPSADEDALILSVADQLEAEAMSGGRCDGLSASDLPTPDAALARAIPYLTPRQKTILALMRSDGRLRRLFPTGPFSESTLYVLPQIQAERTVEFLQAGYAALDPLALEGLVMLHAPGSAVRGQGVRVSLPNPKLFLQYAWTMAHLFGNDALPQEVQMLMGAVRARLTADEMQQINYVVDAEVKRWTRATGAGVQQGALADEWRKVTTADVDLTDCDNGL